MFDKFSEFDSVEELNLAAALEQALIARQWEAAKQNG